MNNESGYALLGTLLILVLLIVIGLVASTNTNLEIQIAGNDRIHKETFYQADGGTQIGIRMVEESIGNMGPFVALNALHLLNDPVPAIKNDRIMIIDNDLAFNEHGRDKEDIINKTSSFIFEDGGGRDIIYYPDGYNPALPDNPHTNIIADGVTSTVAGAGLQMLAGYEGKGKGTAGGGGQILYSIYSQHIGRSQSESVVKVEWRHVIGLELDPRY